MKLLKDMHCHVVVPPEQTCCGQPAYNSGDRHDTKQIAKQVIEIFEEFDYVVVLFRVLVRACCVSITLNYLQMMLKCCQKHSTWLQGTYELISFLVDVLGMARSECIVSACNYLP